MPTIITRIKHKGKTLHRTLFTFEQEDVADKHKMPSHIRDMFDAIQYDLEHFTKINAMASYSCAYRCIFVGRSMFAEFDDYRVEVDYEP